jgi:hypothetical protein
MKAVQIQKPLLQRQHDEVRRMKNIRPLKIVFKRLLSMDLGVFNDVKQGFPTCGPWKVFKIE